MSEKNISLPCGYYEKDNRIYGPKCFRTNGTFHVGSYCTKVSENGITKNEVTVTFEIGIPPNIKTITKTIPINDLNSYRVLKYIPDDFIMSGSDHKKQNFFSEAINNTIIDMTPQEIYVLEQGFNKVNDKMIYALGDTVINADSQNYITGSKHKVKAHPDNNDFIKWLMRFSKLGMNYPVLLLSAIVSYVKPLIKASGIQGEMGFSLYYYGNTGCGKTESLKLLTRLFEDDENIVSLSSDKETIYKLSRFRDTVVMIDDLNKTDSRRVKDANEAKISNFLQQTSSVGTIKYKGENVKINSTIFITAEYPPKNHSTVNRCLIVEASEIDMNALTWLQESQSLYVDFVIKFIEWICKNFTELTDCVKRYREIFKPNKTFNEKCYNGSARIKRTELVLNITKMLFMKFITDGLYITDKGKNFIDQAFKYSINNCISETLYLVKRDDDPSNRAYVDVLLDILSDQNGNFYVAESFKEYKRFKKERNIASHKKYESYKVFFKDNDCYCIKGDDLLKLYQNLDDFEYKSSKKAISAQFKNYGFLKIQGDELSFPLKKSGKQRFYHLKLSAIAGEFDENQKTAMRCSELADDFEGYMGEKPYYGSWKTN